MHPQSADGYRSYCFRSSSIKYPYSQRSIPQNERHSADELKCSSAPQRHVYPFLFPFMHTPAVTRCDKLTDTCAYTFTHPHAHIRTHTHTYSHPHAYSHAHIPTRVHTHTYAHTHTHPHAHSPEHSHAHPHAPTRTCPRVHACTHQAASVPCGDPPQEGGARSAR